MFGTYRDNGRNDSDGSYDSDDSNAENYYKNEYPDEESDIESVTDEDMIKAVTRMNTNESDLSSDEGEEQYPYDEDNVDAEDVLRYGKLYAKFKATWKERLEEDSNNHLHYEDSDDYYD